MADDQEDNALGESTLEDGPPASGPPEQGGAVKPASPSIVIGPLIIESGATPVIAVIMLVAGIIIGFLLRPEVSLPATGPAPTSQAVASQPTIPPTKAPAAATATPMAAAALTRTPAPPTATVNPTVVAQQRKELTAFVVSNTRHFKGNANAPVTLIEFSDYQ